MQVEHRRWHGFAFLRYGFDQNQSGFAVRGLEMEVLAQGFAIRALVLPSDCKLSIVDGMVLLSRGMVLDWFCCPGAQDGGFGRGFC